MTFLHHLTRRECNSVVYTSFEREQHVTKDFILRLCLEKELVGHKGCVNCLEWSNCGRLLASGSDDQYVNLWNPHRHKLIRSLRTQHTANIFSVKFLPESQDHLIATGAADANVTVVDIENRETINVFACHAGRVKRLAVAPGQPAVFWSAGEDGRILQFDLRAPELNAGQDPRNMLIDLTALAGYQAEAKCLAINPCRPEQMAVGANDPYVRLFDRRMLTCKAPSSVPANGRLERPAEDPDLSVCAAHYYTAGHLPDKTNVYKKRFRALASTYVTFSPDGTSMLVNIGGEQIYLFDIISGTPMRRRIISDMTQGEGTAKTGLGSDEQRGAEASNDTSASGRAYDTSLPSKTSYQRKLPKRALRRSESFKQRANKEFDEQHFALSISLYNEALKLNPVSAVLYCNRAAALLKRAWDGDVYAAASDCLAAIALDVDYVKAYYRLCKCIHVLGWHRDVVELLAYLRRRFPSHPTLTGNVAAINEMEKAAVATIKTAAPGSSDPKKNGTTDSHGNMQQIATIEATWVSEAYDYSQRFCGHCNTTTDIKEANFFGSNGQYVVAGSDDGSFFIWDRQTTNIVRVLRGDQSIVNCLQPHPTSCLLASSGIESVVRLWSPGPVDENGHVSCSDNRAVDDSFDVALANQRRMNADPIEVMLRSMGYDLSTTRATGRGRPASANAAHDASEPADYSNSSDEDNEITMQCRQF